MSLLDALGYVGDTLAKPGRAVRGALAGRPDEILSALPFSDSLGITDPGRAVHGRDLLEQLGLVDKGQDDMGSFLGGLGVDVATDPLMYFGGAAARAGLRAFGKSPAAITPGAAAGAAVDDGTFSLVDPISRLVSPTEEAATAMRGATSPWTPKGQIDLPPAAPMDTAVPLEGVKPPIEVRSPADIRATLPPLREIPNPDSYGWDLAHGPHYQDLGANYNLPGWSSSIPLEMAQDGQAMRGLQHHFAAWDRALADLERMTPEAKLALGVPEETLSGGLMDLSGPMFGDIPLHAHAAPWQQALGTRQHELEAMLRLVGGNALPAEFASAIENQVGRIAPLTDRFVPEPEMLNRVRDLHGGQIRPSQIDELVGSSGPLGHLPVDTEALRAMATRGQTANLTDDVMMEFERLGLGEGNLAGIAEHDPPWLINRIHQILDPAHYPTIDRAIAAKFFDMPPEGEVGPIIQALRQYLWDNGARL